jgi:pilus assembly protein CpaB
MRVFGVVLLVVALFLGGITFYGIRTVVGSRAEAAKALSRDTVVVAARPIAFGQTLTPESLKVEAWPADARPQGSFRTIKELINAQARVALRPMEANEPILATRISGPGGRAGLSGVIQTGKRAVTIRVNDVIGVAGFVLPGDFVDVLITRQENKGGGSQAPMRTDTLLQSVRVLAVDQLANEKKGDPVVAKAATVEVDPEQAQKLALASEVGTLSLALRGQTDPLAASGANAPATVRIEDLRPHGADPQVEPTPKPAPHKSRPTRIAAHRHKEAAPATQVATVEVVRGAQPTNIAVVRE